MRDIDPKILDQFQAMVTQQSLGEPENAMTSRQLAEFWNMSISGAQKQIRRLLAAGELEELKCMVNHDLGKPGVKTVPYYRSITPEKRNKGKS